MALARRRGTADDDDEGFPHSAREEDSSSYVSPGMEKKREHPSGWHNREEVLGGWVGGSGLFGNAVKLFENVGDVVTNIVARFRRTTRALTWRIASNSAMGLDSVEMATTLMKSMQVKKSKRWRMTGTKLMTTIL